MKATRIAYSKGLTQSKFEALEEQARRLGRVHSEVWQRSGSLASVQITERQIRDSWLADGRQFDVPANAWKETLRDAKADVSMTLEAAKLKAPSGNPQTHQGRDRLRQRHHVPVQRESVAGSTWTRAAQESSNPAQHTCRCR